MQRRALGGAEAGETLVEIMVTVAILGVAMVAILGAIWTTLRIADVNSKSSDADTVLRAYAETMKQPDNGDEFQYVPCTVAGGQVTYPTYVPATPYEDYVASIERIQYLNGYSGSNEPIWANACPAAIDGGLQQLTLKVTGPTDQPEVSSTQRVTVVKRDTTSDVMNSSTDPEDP